MNDAPERDIHQSTAETLCSIAHAMCPAFDGEPRENMVKILAANLRHWEQQARADERTRAAWAIDENIETYARMVPGTQEDVWRKECIVGGLQLAARVVRALATKAPQEP